MLLCVLHVFAALSTLANSWSNNIGSFSRILQISVFAFFFQSLRDKQKAVRESQAPNMKQMKMWSVSSFSKTLLLLS